MDQFRALPRSTTPPAGLPSPEHPESGSLPTHDGLWPENHQWSFPPRPSSLQHHPQTSIPAAELWSWRLPFEDDDLVPQRQNFQHEFVLRSQQRPGVDQSHPEEFKHVAPASSKIPANQSFRSSTEFLPPTRPVMRKLRSTIMKSYRCGQETPATWKRFDDLLNGSTP